MQVSRAFKLLFATPHRDFATHRQKTWSRFLLFALFDHQIRGATSLVFISEIVAPKTTSIFVKTISNLRKIVSNVV